ncbi:unnamed protein product [Paramecium sonneborni]|uniref:Uncharacterized protein n=1 Tax=Paramecium sonneborni TaxID=65129 RepID=A0A8S1PI67_9CILI|nr:unnamed protein product [Paramecium sonneborni]
MLNLNYESKEIYTFKNIDQILKVLQYDDFGIFNINFEKNTITYYINHLRCIRLSDLLFWIENDLVRIYLEQLLVLVLKLLEKVDFLESQEIKHNYLDENRIWLVQEQTSSSPSLISQFLLYEIHFTGYQCPFYEKYSKKIQITTQIKIIVKLILEKCIENIGLKQKITPLSKKDILQSIIDKCKDNSNISEIQKSIQDLLQKYNYKENIQNNIFQFLDIYDDSINSDRNKQIESVNIQINQIIEHVKQDGQLQIEILLQYIIPIISKQVAQNSKANLDYKNFVEKKREFLAQQELQLKQNIQQSIKHEISNSINEYEKEFRFQITQSEINQIENEIISSIFCSQQVKYFNNTYWLHFNNQEIVERKIVVVSKIIVDEVKDKIKLLYMFKILELIDNLI